MFIASAIIQESRMKRAWVVSLSLLAAGCGDDDSTTSANSKTGMTFFVTSATSVTGNLGGVAGADPRRTS
jgi:hypothetical protein